MGLPTLVDLGGDWPMLSRFALLLLPVVKVIDRDTHGSMLCYSLVDARHMEPL